MVLFKNTNLLQLLSEYHVTQGGFMVSVCSLAVEREQQEDTLVCSPPKSWRLMQFEKLALMTSVKAET